MRRRLLVALPAALAACATPSPRVFTLRPEPGTAVANTPPALLMRSVLLPKYLDRPQIVRSDGVELSLYELDRWGEPLADLTTRVLASNLGMRMPETAVLAETSVAAPAGASLLEVDLSRFDSDPGGIVVLAGQFAVLPPGSGAVPLLRRFRIEQAAQGTGAEGLAVAMGRALGRLADEIAASLSAAAPARPAPPRSSRPPAGARR